MSNRPHIAKLPFSEEQGGPCRTERLLPVRMHSYPQSLMLRSGVSFLSKVLCEGLLLGI